MLHLMMINTELLIVFRLDSCSLLLPIIISDYYSRMEQICTRTFRQKCIYFQVYISIFLLGCAGYFFVNLLYCESQINILASFRLSMYQCWQICPNFPNTDSFDSYLCCDTKQIVCVTKSACLNDMIDVLINKQDYNGIVAASLTAFIPLLMLVHIIIRICVLRSRRERMRALREEMNERMGTVQSFLHNDPQNQCSICLDHFNNEKAIKLICGHTFHNHCIREWGASKRTCPVCRAQQ